MRHEQHDEFEARIRQIWKKIREKSPDVLPSDLQLRWHDAGREWHAGIEGVKRGVPISLRTVEDGEWHQVELILNALVSMKRNQEM